MYVSPRRKEKKKHHNKKTMIPTATVEGTMVNGRVTNPQLLSPPTKQIHIPTPKSTYKTPQIPIPSVNTDTETEAIYMDDFMLEIDNQQVFGNSI